MKKSYHERYEEMNLYLKQVGSKKTYLYEVFSSEGMLKVWILADNDDEAKQCVKILDIKASYIRQDHWGKGPKIYL